MTKKEELLKELEKLEKQENKKKASKEQEENYKAFQRRKDDYVIGKAHQEMCVFDRTYVSELKKAMIPASVSISGNCGTIYYPIAFITESTKTYFHNVWEEIDRQSFQKKLNTLVQKEIDKISKDITVVLELMGLQSDYKLKEKYGKYFDKVKKEVIAEQAKVLDRYSDKDFLKLIKKQSGWMNSDTGEPVSEYKDVNLSHSKTILFRYIKSNRKKLIKHFKELNYWDN